ncbi:class I SAM-dependent methyltransferase [Nonomuraea sp. NPDC049269]|uniref:class I SAM-dependent methyltransferase n=1 Tax=Nonomuraea sp. NPDC049269 TaxID=3364349 RepID=UPI0037193F68
MATIPIDFTGVRVTALVELYLRWLDSKDPHPILGDPWADRVVRRLGFDFSSFKPMALGRYAVGVRSRVMDEWTREYLAKNPDAIVLDLGCGFDSRVFRIDPAPGHHWYDVDFPDVIEIMDQLYPQRPEHTTIGASVVDPAWLDRIPGDRPVIVVADGLYQFLDEDEVRQVFRNIMDHFPTGQFVFNIGAASVKRRYESQPNSIFAQHGITFGWTIESAREAERLDDRLHYVDQRSVVEAALIRHASLYYRMLCAVISMVPAWRNAGFLLRYRF